MPTEEPLAHPEKPPGETAALVGTTIAGRYKVEKWLGEGGMGAVYLVQHTGIRKRLALKLLRPALSAIPAVLTRFEREAMAAAHLDHPNVAAAIDYGRTEDGRFYLALEYVEGQELRAALNKAQGPLPIARALFIARQIASALVRAHEVGIVHRDLKPENVMLVQREGHGDFVKVLDFGLAQVPQRITEEPSEEGGAEKASKLTKMGDIFGTPPYMAPEQTVGESTDGRTDLYALGIILYEMLAGVRPFTGKSILVLIQQHLSTPPPPICERAPTVKVPKEVEALVQRLLAKKPEERFQHPQELLAAIDRITATYQLVWPPGTPTWTGGSSAQESAVGKRISSISHAFTALRIRPATILALSKCEDTLLRLQRRLPGPMQRISRWLLIGGLIVAVVLPIGLLLRTRQDAEPAVPLSISKDPVVRQPPAEVTLAPQSAVDTASAQGSEALASLASRYPKDPQVRRVLLHSYSNQHRHVEAMRLIAELAMLDPSTGTDLEIVKSIVAALQSDAASVEAVAELLETGLGESGVDLLYDLTLKQTGARWKPRLNQSLSKPEVLAKASPAARVALELRAARRCEAKRDLLVRAEQEGDRRALVQIKSLTQTKGCGFLGLQDCWPCLRKTSALQDAIVALESRNNVQKQP